MAVTADRQHLLTAAAPLDKTGIKSIKLIGGQVLGGMVGPGWWWRGRWGGVGL